MYEELVARELERVCKEKEQERRERREKEDRQRARKLRCETMLSNLEVLKDQAEQIQGLEDLLTFSELLQRDFSPPESYTQ
jgi:hypothetical protein